VESRKNKVFIKKISNSYDQKLRIYSFYELPTMPLQISLIFFGDDLLAAWKAERFSDLVFYIIFILFVAVVAFFSIELAKKVHKLRISEARALAASKAKSDFLANMSHELRTPLNAIIGFSEMLAEEYFGEVNPKQKERLKDIHGCGNHLLSVISDVLEFSKGQAGKMELNSENVTVKRLVDEVVRIFEDRIKLQGISIISNISAKAPVIFVDKRKIKQVLINLISNSVKFTESSGIIEVFSDVDETGNFILYVKDNGIGIDEADIPKAMSAFGQVHKDQTKGGTGLGLPLCKVFAELHGGDLEVTSKKNVGTIVTVTLPNYVIMNEFIAGA
jgi:signal transduction histidine kinase